MIVVSDTSPLSGLAIAGYLGLLEQLYGRVLIPSGVWHELQRGGEDDPRITDVLGLDWIKVGDPTNQQLVNVLQTERHLDRGESEAIALALEVNAEELLIDERLGRREAIDLGLSITGLLGILLVAKRRGLITQIRPIMDSLILEANFRISPNLYREVLAAAGE
ncbi:nucleic acid-binding protein [Phormidium willei BDU 130791]|nr:nucleic acid-binding protein [Phormidium willei BDU 130791]